MNKNKKRPPYWMLIIGGIIGLPLEYAILIFGKTEVLEDYPRNYVIWLKSEGIILEILYVFGISIFYIILWFGDKRYIKKNNT